MTYEPLIIWDFYKAPEELQSLSTNGGDEDWIAEVSPTFNNGYRPFWLEEGTSFGCFSVNEYEHPTKAGWKILIGCHA